MPSYSTPNRITRTGLPYAFQNVPAVDLTSLTPPGNHYFKTPTPTFSWNPVVESDIYYRLWIFDPLGRITLWRSPWASAPSATVPAGLLTPGGTYYWTVQTALASNTTNVQVFTNAEGNSLNRVMYRFTLAPPRKGDLSGNGEVGLEDAILALKILSGYSPSIVQTGDVDGDKRVGLPEVIYILQELSGRRESSP